MVLSTNQQDQAFGELYRMPDSEALLRVLDK